MMEWGYGYETNRKDFAGILNFKEWLQEKYVKTMQQVAVRLGRCPIIILDFKQYMVKNKCLKEKKSSKE